MNGQLYCYACSAKVGDDSVPSAAQMSEQKSKQDNSQQADWWQGQQENNPTVLGIWTPYTSQQHNFMVLLPNTPTFERVHINGVDVATCQSYAYHGGGDDEVAITITVSEFTEGYLQQFGSLFEMFHSFISSRQNCIIVSSESNKEFLGYAAAMSEFQMELNGQIMTGHSLCFVKDNSVYELFAMGDNQIKLRAKQVFNKFTQSFHFNSPPSSVMLQEEIFCEKCGILLESDSKFCIECGTQQQQPKLHSCHQSTSQKQPMQSDESVLRAWKASWVFSIFGLLVAPFLFGFIGLAGFAGYALGVAMMIGYAALVYPSYFTEKPLLKSSRVISFANGLFGMYIFTALWNMNLTYRTRGISHIVYSMLVPSLFMLLHLPMTIS